MKSNTVRSIEYRPEIDGLRALSVFFVIIYHAKTELLGWRCISGGYIGVDIFFVISGYLLSNIILKEIQEGEFSLLQFYERRARRILPTLFFVLIVTSIFSWQLLTPTALVEYAKSLVATSFFSANIFFYLQDTYAAESSSIKPLLHMWSLGVEEQFYIFYPLILIGAARWGHRLVKLLLALLFISSFLFCEFSSFINTDFNFYMSPTRAWELIAGGLLASYESRLTNTALVTRWANVFSFLGLLVLLFSAFCFTDYTNHPSALTLLPVLATIMIILCSNKKNYVKEILSNKLLGWFGLISFSLYLWHQPALALSRTFLNRELTLSETLLLLVSCVLLSAASYYLIEQPMRNRTVVPPRTIWQLVPASLIYAIVFGYMNISRDGYAERFFNISAVCNDASYGNRLMKNNYQNLIKDLHIKTSEKPFRFLFSSSGKYTLLTVGDSHTKTLVAPTVINKDKLPFISSFVPLDKPGCLFVLGLDRSEIKNLPNKQKGFINYNQKRLEVIKKFSNPIVVLGGRLPLQLENSRFNNKQGGIERGEDNPVLVTIRSGKVQRASKEDIEYSYQSTISELLQLGAKIILIYPVPEVGWDVPKTLIRQTQKMNLSQIKTFLQSNTISTSYDVFEKRTKKSYAIYDSIPDAEGLLRIYPENIFCDGVLCYTHNEDRLYYRDDDHLSYYGATLLMNHILKKIHQKWPELHL